MDKTEIAIAWGYARHNSSRADFVSAWQTPSAFIDADNPAQGAGPELTIQLGTIWDAAHMSIKDMREHAGMTRPDFADAFCIPYRTLQNWELGTRETPVYVLFMVARLLGVIEP